MKGSESAHVAIIRRWCESVTEGDLNTVRAMVSEDVEFHGPRGVGTGADVVVEWVARSGIQIEPLRLTGRGTHVVAECTATWPDPEARSSRTTPMMTMLTFDIRDHRIVAIQRSDLPESKQDAEPR